MGMNVRFGNLIPGQLFSWNSQYFVKIFPTDGFNAAQLGVKWEEKVYGYFQDDTPVSQDEDQLPAKTPQTIMSTSSYEALVDSESWLSALEEAGVDNWEGYEDARRIYQETT